MEGKTAAAGAAAAAERIRHTPGGLRPEIRKLGAISIAKEGGVVDQI